MTNPEVSVKQLDEGVRRVTLPLPTGPRHVHCYIVGGTLFDTGIGLEPPPWRDLGVERIAITHFHPDHVGGAEAAAAETGATVYQGALDYAQCERVWGSADWPERIADWFVTHGVPEPLVHDLIEQGHAFAPFIRFARDPELFAHAPAHPRLTSNTVPRDSKRSRRASGGTAGVSSAVPNAT